MSIEIAILTKTSDPKGGVIAASFKAFKASTHGSYKTFGDCTFSPKHSGKSFIQAEDVTDAIVIGWIKKELGKVRLTAIDSILSARITEDANYSGFLSIANCTLPTGSADKQST